MKYCIVAVGYNRAESMRRLIDSVLRADYGTETVDLIISIDKSDNQDEVIKKIGNVDWKHGKFMVNRQEERLGLRKHILKCGNLTESYDALIMFEDDIVVSPCFFNYVKQTVDHYKDDERIAGISLYKHETHPGVYRPFIPADNGYDVFLMQFAQSWGQCWTAGMWKSFKDWYAHNENAILGRDSKLPSYIANWNNNSWLKYFMRYIVESNKYFVYPYTSLSTNASESGEHNTVSNNNFQVPLLFGNRQYRFPTFDQAVRYDVYFEREDILDQIFPRYEGVKILDLYGDKKDFSQADYLISTQTLTYRKRYSFQIKYRPHEINCMIPEKGYDAFVYDLKQTGKRTKKQSTNSVRYDVRALSWKKLLRLGVHDFRTAITSRIKHIFKK